MEPDDSLALITFDAHTPLLEYRISHKTWHKICEMMSSVFTFFIERCPYSFMNSKTVYEGPKMFLKLSIREQKI